MKTIKRIIVGVDFSLYSPVILKYAADIAEKNTAEIVAVNVINRRQIEYLEKAINNEQPQTFSLEKFITDQTSERTRKLGHLINTNVSKQVPTKIIIRSGEPFEEILDVADDEKADLLIISSKGRTNFRDYMFGTTAEKIFRHSPVSLLSLNLWIER